MIAGVMRRAGRAGLLALHLGYRCLSAAGSGLWSIPPPSVASHERQTLAFDPAELDSWIEKVLSEADPPQ